MGQVLNLCPDEFGLKIYLSTQQVTNVLKLCWCNNLRDRKPPEAKLCKVKVTIFLASVTLGLMAVADYLPASLSYRVSAFVPPSCILKGAFDALALIKLLQISEAWAGIDYSSRILSHLSGMQQIIAICCGERRVMLL